MDDVIFQANGQPVQMAPDQATVDGFLRERQIEPRSVAVEINGQILLRSEWSTRKLLSGDSLEIIRVVAGG